MATDPKLSLEGYAALSALSARDVRDLCQFTGEDAMADALEIALRTYDGRIPLRNYLRFIARRQHWKRLKKQYTHDWEQARYIPLPMFDPETGEFEHGWDAYPFSLLDQVLIDPRQDIDPERISDFRWFPIAMSVLRGMSMRPSNSAKERRAANRAMAMLARMREMVERDEELPDTRELLERLGTDLAREGFSETSYGSMHASLEILRHAVTFAINPPKFVTGFQSRR